MLKHRDGANIKTDGATGINLALGKLFRQAGIYDQYTKSVIS